MQANCPNTLARAARLTTSHGLVETPVFMPVGTQATVKTLTPDELTDIGATIILANTYHLYLRPGVDVVAALSGLHRFMGWNRPILTDSGGFQVFSLGHLRRVDDEGVVFKSHIDGSQHLFTPASVIQLEEQLGADIIMAFDDCAPFTEDRQAIERSMERTHRWAEKCLAAHQHPAQALFGITQGGTFPDLRRRSASFIAGLGFPGFALGGLCLGEPKEVMHAMIEESVAVLPRDRPRYLMGVGSPEDLLEGVSRGIDMFDAVLPTRIARNGALFTITGRKNIRNAGFRLIDQPIEPGCDCYTCQRFSAAYLHHLFKSEELLGHRLATIHNLRFLHRLMAHVRQAITSGTFLAFKTEFLASYRTTDQTVRLAQKQKWLIAQRAKGAGQQSM
ncbi:MAG: tRNA guanosine(34) transglycosylase Tgt [Chloroflexi bacterium]|nr:tRNA guanosine(34) transglycosylase Tgt [Chloroflexota bacterium]